jgi:hypothetical protein
LRPLSKHIRALIPDGGTGVTSQRNRTDMLFSKFRAQVDVAAFRATVRRIEGEILARAPRRGLLDLIESGDPATDARLREKYLTARSDGYNVMYWDEPWVGEYYWAIKLAFHQFVDAHNISIVAPLYIHSWANCLRSGQHLFWHAHGDEDPDGPGAAAEQPMVRQHREQRVSGTFSAHVPVGSKTYYRLPPSPSSGKSKVLPNPNLANDLVLFQSNIEHRSCEISDAMQAELSASDTDCRITSSWDISPEPTDVFHAVPFYDPDDLFFAGDPGTARMLQAGEGLVRECLAVAARDKENDVDGGGGEGGEGGEGGANRDEEEEQELREEDEEEQGEQDEREERVEQSQEQDREL